MHIGITEVPFIYGKLWTWSWAEPMREMSLQSNVVARWLRANLESALYRMFY